MTLAHKLAKLRRMKSSEIMGRLACEWRVNRLVKAASRSRDWDAMFAIPAGDVIQRCVEVVPGVQRNELAEFKNQHPSAFQMMADRSVERGQLILLGQYALLGKTPRIAPDIDWHRDPDTGYTWSRDIFTKVAYHKSPEHVDFKNVWELGRQQYVVELSRSWLLTGDERHGVMARDMMLSWIEQNPFCKGIHWTSGLEVGMRAISWIWTLANLHDFSGWNKIQLRKVVTSLGQHALYLENHFSFYSSPYNHVIGEATGLRLVAEVLKGVSAAGRWKKRSEQVLMEFAPKQFYQDGFCVEQAMGYHYYTLGFLLMAELVADGASSSGLDLKQTLRDGFGAGLCFRQPNGLWPAIGDVDSAQAIPVARESYWNFSPTHCLAAVLLKDSALANWQGNVADSKPGKGKYSSVDDWGGEELYWLTGCDGIEEYLEHCPDNISGENKKTLPDSGYFVAGNSEEQLIFDSGPISHGLHADSTPSAAHGHADTLQVLYQFGGQPVLIDSGMPHYAGCSSRAAHFRSPQAHNTVAVDGAELVRSRGVLDWSNEVDTPVLRTGGSEKFWVASGRVSWPNCSIERDLLGIPGGGLWIVDSLESKSSQHASWYWQLHRRWQFKLRQTEGFVQASGDGVSLWSIASQPGLDAALTEGDETKRHGWISQGYGALEQGCRLSLKMKFDDSITLMTHIGNTPSEVAFVKDGETIQFDKTDMTSNRLVVDSLGCGQWVVSP